MKIITEDECRQWLAARFQGSFDPDVAEGIYKYSATYLIPNDAGRKTALARALTAMVNASGESLLWVTQWGVFPSSENMALFLGYRRSLGDQRSVYEAPGHLFAEADLETVECLLDLIFYFFWDASIFDASSLWLRLSHDEVFSIYTKDRPVLNSCEEALAPFELNELSRHR